MDLTTVSIVVDIYSFYVLCVLISALIQQTASTEQRRMLFILLTTLLAAAVSRLLFWICTGCSILSEFIFHALTSITIISTAAAFPMMIRYIYSNIAGSNLYGSRAKAIHKADMILSAAVLILVTVNIFKPVLFRFDDHHMRFFLAGIRYVNICLGVEMLLLSACVISEKHILTIYRHRLSFYVFMIVLTCIFEPVRYGLSLALGCTVTVLLLMYMNYQLVMEKELESTNLEISRKEISLLLSKTRSGFFFARMDFIHNLCLNNPLKAQYAISELSEFVRGNIDNIDSSAPVPFEKELNYTKHYVNLMKMEYEDLDVFYDIQNSDLTVPYKTIQYLTECAVIDCIENKKFDREICISSCLENNIYNVEVSCTEGNERLLKRYRIISEQISKLISSNSQAEMEVYMDDESTVHAKVCVDAGIPSENHLKAAGGSI